MKIKTKLLCMLLIVGQFHMASVMCSETSLTQHFDNTEYLYSLTTLLSQPAISCMTLCLTT